MLKTEDLIRERKKKTVNTNLESELTALHEEKVEYSRETNKLRRMLKAAKPVGLV